MDGTILTRHLPRPVLTEHNTYSVLVAGHHKLTGVWAGTHPH